MRSSVLAAACAAALSLSPAPLLADGPDAPRRAASAAPCRQQQQAAERPARGRFGEWLRRQVQREGAERSGYYLRSPLLYAFGPDTTPDCEEQQQPAPPVPLVDCAELRVSTAEAARLFLELPLPQLGATTHTELSAVIRAELKNGAAVVVLDERGHPLTLSPAATRAVRVDRCN